MTWRTTEDFARETGPVWRFLRGMVRRVLVTLTGTGTRWQVQGVRSRDGGDEVYDAELFPGVGIYARPPGNAEAIVLGVGGSKTSVIVAARDEETRRLIADQVEVGDTAVYNAVGIVILKASGDIEIRSHGGTASKLVTEVALQRLREAIENAVVVANDGGASFKTTLLANMTDDGFMTSTTTKLRGE